MSAPLARFADWFLRERGTGRIVVAQWPNLPLWIFAGAAVVGWAVASFGVSVPPGLVAALRLVEAAALAWWALDEVLRGANPWRRCLGAAVLLVGLWRLLAGA